MNKNLTELVIVTDRSGSMAQIAADMNGGIKTMLDKQRQEPGQCNITWFNFDHSVEHKLDNKPIDQVGDVKIEPRGMTALIDAVCTAIDTVGSRLANTDENKRPGAVVFAIVTDGLENASKEYTQEQLKSKIKTQSEEFNWQFTYLGANQDAFKVALSYGIDFKKVSNYTKENAKRVFADGVSSLVSTTRMRLSRGDEDFSNLGFSEKIKASLNEVKSN